MLSKKASTLQTRPSRFHRGYENFVWKIQNLVTVTFHPPQAHIKYEAKTGEETMISLERAPPPFNQFLIRGHHFRVHGILSYTHTGIRIHASLNSDTSFPLSLRIFFSQMIFHIL
jgi:hypothetical protein